MYTFRSFTFYDGWVLSLLGDGSASEIESFEDDEKKRDVANRFRSRNFLYSIWRQRRRLLMKESCGNEFEISHSAECLLSVCYIYI